MRNRIRRQRKGIASLLAMLYIILFATLAVGFYAATTTANQVVSNEDKGARAMLSAESGMEIMRYQLSTITVTQDVKQDQILNTVCNALKHNMEGTGNLTSKQKVDITSGVLQIPSSPTDYVAMDTSGNKFHATITQSGMSLAVTVTGAGKDGTITRGISMNYALRATNAPIFNYGIATMGTINIHGNFNLAGDPTDDGGSITGSIYSAYKGKATSVQIKDKAIIAGDINIADNGSKDVVVDKNCSVGGTSDPNQVAAHIHKSVDVPEFPVVETDTYQPYATNTYVKGKTAPGNNNQYYYSNVTIPANTNPNFDKPTVLEGVIYIQMPNKVTFGKNCTVRGVIVVQPSSKPKDYADGKNVIDFHNGADLYGMDSLPVNNAFPQSMHKLSNATIVAPDSDVTFEGNSTVQCGSIIGQDVSFKSRTSGTITGSVVAYGNLDMGGKSGLKMVTPANTTMVSSGLRFTGFYAPMGETYAEVTH